MENPIPVSREAALLARARRVFGEAVTFELRTMLTRAGGRTGILVYGFALVRAAAPESDADPEILGLSPPPGQPLDFSALGTPEEALLDALRRRESGLGPHLLVLEPEFRRPGEPAPPVRPERRARGRSELTTSTMDLSR